MLKKLNKKIILLSFTLTLVLLFGGWFTYQYYGAEKPIQDMVTELEQTELLELYTDQKRVSLTVGFENNPSFGKDILKIYDFVRGFNPEKEVQLNIALSQGENHPWWLEHSAQITEAVHQKQYSELSGILEEWQEQGLISEGNVRMNQNHLFIYVKPVNDSEVYIYIPFLMEKQS